MSSGTRPNPLSQVLVDRGVRLAVGLAVVIAIPVAVLFYFQFRSLNDLEATSAVVLRQLSSDTADSLAQVDRRGAQATAHLGAARHPAVADGAARSRVHRAGPGQGPGREPVHRRVLRLDRRRRRRAADGALAGVRSAPAPASDGPMGERFREDPDVAGAAAAQAAQMSRRCASGHRRLLGRPPRSQALHPDAAALGVARRASG